MSDATQSEGGGGLAQLDAGERVLRSFDARVGKVAREWKWQEAANTSWAYVRMGRMSGERGLKVKEGRGGFESVVIVINSCNYKDRSWWF